MRGALNSCGSKLTNVYKAEIQIPTASAKPRLLVVLMRDRQILLLNAAVNYESKARIWLVLGL